MLHGNLFVKEEIKRTPKTFPKQLKTKYADLMKKGHLLKRSVIKKRQMNLRKICVYLFSFLQLL